MRYKIVITLHRINVRGHFISLCFVTIFGVICHFHLGAKKKHMFFKNKC